MILFYKRPATTLQQHEAVYDAIVSRLEENGYTAKSAKLDPACRSGVQSFYYLAQIAPIKNGPSSPLVELRPEIWSVAPSIR